MQNDRWMLCKLYNKIMMRPYVKTIGHYMHSIKNAFILWKPNMDTACGRGFEGKHLFLCKKTNNDCCHDLCTDCLCVLIFVCTDVGGVLAALVSIAIL